MRAQIRLPILQFYKNIFGVAWLGTFLLLLGCEISGPEKLLIKSVFEEPPGEPGSSSGSGSEQACYTENHQQSPGTLTQTIDILFVTDTSGSLDQERAAIADGIDAFVAELPPGVDYRIGVMLAHGNNTGWSGKLYRRGSEPIVLNSQTMSLAMIRQHLRTKLTQTAGDGQTDGGEAGLYSMHRALQPEKLAISQAAGFFRDDAALAVVYVSDENDICSGTPPGVTLVPDPDGNEIPAAALYCGSVNAQSVLTELRTRQAGRPLLVAGIIYNNPATVPWGGENEVGYGYLEQIQLANGISVDLAAGNYQAGLSDIGRMATLSLSLKTEFPLQHSPVVQSSISVTVDMTAVTHTYVEALNEVQLKKEDAGGALSTISIYYCTDESGGGSGGGGGGGCTGISCGGGGIGV